MKQSVSNSGWSLWSSQSPSITAAVVVFYVVCLRCVEHQFLVLKVQWNQSFQTLRHLNQQTQPQPPQPQPPQPQPPQRQPQPQPPQPPQQPQLPQRQPQPQPPQRQPQRRPQLQPPQQPQRRPQRRPQPPQPQPPQPPQPQRRQPQRRQPQRRPQLQPPQPQRRPQRPRQPRQPQPQLAEKSLSSSVILSCGESGWGYWSTQKTLKGATMMLHCVCLFVLMCLMVLGFCDVPQEFYLIVLYFNRNGMVSFALPETAEFELYALIPFMFEFCWICFVFCVSCLIQNSTMNN